MVTRLPCLLLLLAASPAPAADWSGAGGALIVGPANAQVTPDPPIAQPAALSELSKQPFAELVDAAAARHGLDPKLLHSLVLVESGYRADAVSLAGAVGLTQLMPATARELGVTDRNDPRENLLGGAAYLSAQLERFRDLRLALAAYNAGPARVEALGRVPAIEETEVYVDRVISCFLALTAGRPVRSVRACEPQAAKP
ncbi:MAG: lytic transglycosylase domain-containing protein [Phenylobacterium sp.]|uniref:lytic transglycosylase domain-containing protein n=1 Tax=Phenylobacterium sp. TaxID=1871053 RepID=UPI0025D657E7|nr:lytic transglycosylase domain-containing protein [Phenylobacterium sp.]MBA4011008.1 lytic transglycosylase domain-containing protein [Phenylobacterium sp.]